jgi:hypothetical protein
MQGTGPGVVIQPPSTLTTDLGQVSLTEIGGGATVNISNLTIEGAGPEAGHVPGHHRDLRRRRGDGQCDRGHD